ncbi:MAG: hypothetical protein HFJ28_04530 [Clostridia bacterium]|jgi:phenylalanyl-tRNA synthetase beta subunit|nr:hypothetical protein [Clostridia bacterium]
MSDDMSDIMQKLNDMIKNDQIPDNIKNMMNQFGATSSNKNDLSSSENTTENNKTEDFNLDMGTILKMKSIMDSMNKEQNDPRANLLKSLKPYLKSSRKQKVDQYIKLFGMGKIFEIMNPMGGEKKNDV